MRQTTLPMAADRGIGCWFDEPSGAHFTPRWRVRSGVYTVADRGSLAARPAGSNKRRIQRFTDLD